MAQDCKEPVVHKELAVHTKAAQQVEVASNHLAAAVVAAVVVAAVHIGVAVAGTGVPGRTAAVVAARAIGSHHSEGMETECFAGGAVVEAQGMASSRLAVVARARHRQQLDVLREACCRVEYLAQWSGCVCDKVVEGWSVQRIQEQGR